MDIISDNEVSFWKVFHNKYLFQLIFNHIESTEWIQYDNTDGYHTENKKKFKDIKCLNWIIKNGQYQLLKMKLEHNETIKIDVNSLKQLFFIQKENSKKSFLKFCLDKGTYKDGDELLYKNGQLKISNRNQLNSDLLSLILKHKSNQLLQEFDLFDILLSDYKNGTKKNENDDGEDEDEDDGGSDYGESDDGESDDGELDEPDTEKLNNIKYKPNLKLLNVFKNEPFSLSITNNMVKNALKNHPYNDTLIEFILDNSKSNKKFKQMNGSALSTNGEEECEPISMSFEIKHFLKIKSISIQNRLLDLNYVELGNGYNEISISSDNNNRIKELYNQYIKISKKQVNNLSTQEFRNDAERICKVYLKKYDQVMNSAGLGLNNNFIVKYGLERYHSNSINYLISLDKFEFNKIKDNKSNLSTSTTTSNNFKQPITNEFIKCYTNDIIYSKYQCTSIDNDICSYIHSIYGTDEYQLAINSISNHEDFKKINFTKSMWLTISSLRSPISELFILRDKERIDWIVENYEQVESKSKDFTFLSSELIEYAKLKFQSSQKLANYFNQNKLISISKTLFSLALNKCDVKSMEYLNDNFKAGDFISFEDCSKFLCQQENDQDKLINQQIKEIKKYTAESFINLNNQTTSNLIELLDNLNSNKFKLFTNSMFQSFIRAIDYSVIGNGNGGNIDLSVLKINFSVFEDLAVSMFLESFGRIKSIGSIELFLNNFNPFSTKNTLDKLLWGKLSVYGSSVYYSHPGDSIFHEFSRNCLFYDIKTNKHDDSTIHYGESGESSDVLIQVIELILCKFVENYNVSSLGSPKIIPLLTKKFTTLLNFLFKKLIKSNGITTEKVKSVVSNIETTWMSTIVSKKPFNFQHSVFYSFFYLGIRSMKLVKFILELPSTNFHLVNSEYDGQYEGEDESFINIYNFNEKDKLKNGDIFQYLDPNIFTFDFIFKSSFNTILSTLISHLLYSPFITIGDIKCKPDEILDSIEMYYESLDTTLCYLLDIREFELFSKTLDTIQSQLNDKTIQIGQFPESSKGKRVFLYSDDLQSKAIKVLNIDLFNKFYQFNSGTSIDGKWKTKKVKKLL